MNRSEIITKIKSNIQSVGHHITIVSGGQEPRYAYTIGITKKHNIELILAGGSCFLKDDIYAILNDISKNLKGLEGLENKVFIVESLGNFKLRKVHSSWSKITMLGVLDYFEVDTVNAYQVLPDHNHYTLDIPDMSKEWKIDKEPCWRWLKEKWKYNVSDKTTVVTNLDALKGKPVTEVMRWEREEWEMFAGSGPDVQEKDIRVVPIGLLFGIDESLIPALNLKESKGMWRENIGDSWKDWG